MKAHNENLLEIHDLSVSFRMYDSALEQKELQVISDLHLTVRPGEIVAVAAAGLNSDVPLLLGVTLFSALFVCVGNMIANLLYGVVDPQIQEVAK